MKNNHSNAKDERMQNILLIIEQLLKGLPHTEEDVEKISKICAAYGRKRNVSYGDPKIMAASFLWTYSCINFLGEEKSGAWKQKSLANFCGVNVNTISKWGRYIMTALRIEQMDQRFSRQEVAEKNPWLKLRIDPRSGLIFSEDKNPELFGVPLMRNKSDYYYDAMENLNCGNEETAVHLLRKSLEIDEHYVEAYVGMATVYRQKGNLEKYREYAEKAYVETKRAFPQWPEEMSWYDIENRQFLRAIADKAFICWETGQKEQTEELFRLLLKLNPNDNQGIRYLLAGFFAGITGDDIDALMDKGNELQNWSAIENLLAVQNESHNFWKEPK